MKLKKNKSERRNFLSKLGKGAVGISLLSIVPFNLFASGRKQNSIKVKVHPSAVKREGR